MNLFLLILSLFSFTYIRGPIEQQYPPSCLYLSAQPLAYADLTQTNADSICALNVGCAGTRSFLSFNTQPLIDRYTCTDTGPYACGTYIELGNLVPRTVVEPLFRRLSSSGINATDYWSLTSNDGQFLDCAVADTTDNTFLFDWQSIQCNGTRHFLCECIEPNGISDELVILTFPPFQVGDIGFSNNLIRIVIGAWYITSVNLDPPRNVERYVSGQTIQTNGSFSVERVNQFGPYFDRVMVQLRGNSTSFVTEYNEYGVAYTINSVGNDHNITFHMPQPGLFELTTLLIQPAAVVLDTCDECTARFCQCMRTINATEVRYRIRGLIQTENTSRITLQYIYPI